MTDPATARTNWMTDNPRPGRKRQIGDTTRDETDAEYTQAADDGANDYLALAQQQTDATQTRTIYDRIAAAHAALAVPVGTTAADIRSSLVETRKILDDLITLVERRLPRGG